ncbi:Gfo/Idh/MocA family oxidoreductase [Dactylosporangium fulvum]|uniref:Gfo/Idh/MocA family oxidoreductase n=1 Tax=Dactylosporangium fulvum TaxID=53359 RepID=A0ABY5VNG6_9ACTN|nr:Gfo/Idh/MocA family oxidoreductase [Dactylosporangium fulvum]UWP79015.1 Gfo/Idh/MocA family oxidoreductase [Dactylosporangium fulvum]
MHRLGIVSGTGTARKRTVPALRESDVCRVSVVHGRNAGALRQLADADPGVAVTTDLAEFAARRDEYDVVFVASPPFLHLEHVEFALTLGKPVICEKPLTSDRAAPARIGALVEAAGVPFVVAHQLRHQPAVAQLRSLIQDGELGAVSTASLQWSFWMNHDAPSASWKLDPALGGPNALFDAGVHAVDLALHLFGRPEAVRARGHHARSTRTADTVVATLDYRAFAVTVTASQSAGPALNDLLVTCEHGAVRAPGLLAERSLDHLEILTADGSRRVDHAPVNLYRAEIEDFCRHLDGAAHPGTTLHEAILATEIMFAAQDSIDVGGAPVRIGPAGES